MRKELEPLCDYRGKFRGIFKRFGTRTNYKGFHEETILLLQIKTDKGKIVADHVWFHMTKGFQALKPLNEGCIIEFCARVKPYFKGYGEEKVMDYKFNNPTKIRKLGNASIKSLCSFR